MKKLILIFLILFHTSNSFALPAFPGAEGFGSDTVGGRGGTVIKVTNLNDSGAGSFRAACEASGARYVVFNVSGVIRLQSNLVIANPYITIAGQTSPGGICIEGWPTQIWAHDVVVQHIRFRIGTSAVDYDVDGDGDIIYYTLPQYSLKDNHTECADGNTVATPTTGYPCALSSGMDPATNHRAFTIFGDYTPAWYPGADAYNVVVDHCSFSWGIDEVVLIDSAAHDITFSNNISGEGLKRAGHDEGSHSKNMTLSGKFGGVYRVSVHHNYFSNSHDRNTYVSGEFDGDGDLPGVRWSDLRNNVVYNCYTGGMLVQQNGAGNWVHNYVRRGPESTIAYLFELALWTPGPTANNLIYVLGNLGGSRDSQDDPQWCVGDEWRNSTVTTDYQKVSPYDTSGYAVTTTTMSSTYASEVVNGAGATKPFRDSVDERLISEWTNGTGVIPNIVFYPEDYPTYSTPSPPTDSDNDGMSDTWELSTFGDLGQTAITDFDSDGYTDIEEYFHYLASDSPTYDNPSIAGPADFSTTSAYVEIENTYYVDPDLPDQSVIITWTLGESSGFAVASLGVFSATVPVEIGANSIVFEITDSNDGTDSDTVVVTRTAQPSGASVGVTMQGVQWNQ